MVIAAYALPKTKRKQQAHQINEFDIRVGPPMNDTSISRALLPVCQIESPISASSVGMTVTE
jgi:hypothetical protein